MPTPPTPRPSSRFATGLRRFSLAPHWLKRPLILLLALAILIPALRLADYATGYAQSTPGVGIGTTTPHASAILDISFANKGVLFPRMTTAQRDALNAPATGLLIYNTTVKALQVYDGSTWQTSITP